MTAPREFVKQRTRGPVEGARKEEVAGLITLVMSCIYKLCFSVHIESVLRSIKEEDDGVLLQVMRILSLDGRTECKTVLWDTACSGIFVQKEHAEKMKHMPSRFGFCNFLTGMMGCF